MTVLEAEGLAKWYDDVLALNDVSLTLDTGITGLVGPNGAGKTTLLHLATGQLKPSRGRIEVLGHEPWNNPKLRERVGFVPETLALWDTRTGRAHVELAADLTRSASDTDADDWLARVGLAEDADRPVTGYSRGMRQRLKLAMALVHEPELLILDEPFAGLDPVGRREMMELLGDVEQAGRSILFSSHVLHEVETLTKEIAVLVGGRIVATGDVHRVRQLMDQHPHQVRVALDRPREMAQTLIAHEDVVRVRIDDEGHMDDADGGGDGDTGRLLVETRSPEVFYDRLRDEILDGGFDVTEIESPDDNLQAVFNYLTEGGQA